MKHILIYTRQFPTPGSLTDGLFTAQLVEALAKKIDVTVVVPMPTYPWKSIGFSDEVCADAVGHSIKWEYAGASVYISSFFHLPVVTRPFQAYLQSYSLLKLIGNIHKERPIDVINAHFAFPDGVAAEIIGRNLGVPVLVTALGTDINEYRNNFLYRYQISKHLSSAGGVSGKSLALVDSLVELGVSRERVYHTPNGVDLERFSANGLCQSEAKKCLSLDKCVKHMLFVGRLHDVKGLTFLLPAIQSLKAKGALTFKLVIVGSGSLKVWIEKYIEDNSLSENVILVGEQPHSKLQLWYAAVDGFCLPSKAEGMPNALIEALASGLPVTASAVGGVPELVNEFNGYLVDAGDIESLAMSIESMMGRSWSRDEVMSSACFRSWEESAGNYLQIYERLIERGLT